MLKYNKHADVGHYVIIMSDTDNKLLTKHKHLQLTYQLKYAMNKTSTQYNSENYAP